MKTETRTVTYERDEASETHPEGGELVSACYHSSRLQTIETTTVSPTAQHHKVGNSWAHRLDVVLTLIIRASKIQQIFMDADLNKLLLKLCQF